LYDTKGENPSFYRLNTLRVYENNTATFTIELVNTTVVNWSQIGYAQFLCDLKDERQVKLQKRSSKSMQLRTMEDIINALSAGLDVRYVSEYANCYIDGELGMGATGGSNLHNSFDIHFDTEQNYDSYILTWDR
jgi:hypothetical protein